LIAQPPDVGSILLGRLHHFHDLGIARIDGQLVRAYGQRRIPSLLKSVYKVIAYQMKFGSSFIKTVVLAVVTDPIIFLLTSGILLWMYLEEILAEIEKYRP